MAAKKTKGKLKNKKKYMSVMLIPDKEGIAKVYSFSTRYVQLFSIIGFALAILITAGVILTKSLKDNIELKNSVAVLSQQNENHINLLKEKSEKIASFKNREDESDTKINDYVNKYKEIANDYIASRTDSALSSRSGRDERSFISEVSELKEILEEIKELKELNSDDIQIDFTETENKLNEYINHIPTLWPMIGRISSTFGDRPHPVWYNTRPHEGIDIAAYYGQEIAASASGEIIFCGYNSSYGYHIIINHGNGINTLYAHCSKLLVKVGLTVNKGDIIARAGSTGVSTGNHLHFEIRLGNLTTDPLNYLD